MGSFICNICKSTLLYLQNEVCLYCQKESVDGYTHVKCSRPQAVDAFISIYLYKAPIKKIIKNIKYHLVYDAFGEVFAEIEKNYSRWPGFIKNSPNTLFIQPIPLHKQRYNERGFNQSEIVANWLAKQINGTVIDALVRTRYTQPQALLDRSERQANTKGAFSLKNTYKVAQKQVILVDDVVTTGNTTSEAARVLKESGASKVYVFSIAKG